MYNKIDEININIEDCKNISKTAYLYQEPDTGKKFVLKVEQKEEWLNSTELVKQEFRKLVHLSNEPEIATVHFLVKVDNEKVGYLMEYIEGITLKTYIEMNEYIDFDKIVYLLISLINAIDKAHNHGISHQDLHTENIMIDKREYIKIIDFLDMNSLGENDNYKEDINRYKEIVNLFTSKLKNKQDKRRYYELSKFLLSINNAKNVGTKIKELCLTIDELVYYDPFVFRVIRIILRNIDKIDSSFLTLSQENIIDLDEFNELIKTNNTEMLKYLIQNKISKAYESKLISLISINLFLKPLVNIISIEKNIVKYKVFFIFTPKILKLKDIMDTYNLFEIYETGNDKSRTIHDLIFDDLSDFLNEKSLEVEILKLYQWILEQKI